MKTITVRTDEAIKEAKTLVAGVQENSKIVIKSQQTLDKAKEQLGILRQVKKDIKGKKDSVVKPLNEALKNARALFKPVEEKIAVVEDYLKDAMLKYNQKLLEEQKKREEEAVKKVEAGEEIEKVYKKVENVSNKLDQINTRKVAQLKIEDDNLIPREYLVPDERKILEALKTGAKVSGCELEYKEILTNRY